MQLLYFYSMIANCLNVIEPRLVVGTYRIRRTPALSTSSYESVPHPNAINGQHLNVIRQWPPNAFE